MAHTQHPPLLPLSASQKGTRIVAAVSILGFMAYAWSITPESNSAWSPFFSILKDVTGLPCPLCGGTRATHYILHGDWASALYYNWIAFPAAFLGSILAVVYSLETLINRQFFHWRFPRHSWILPSAAFLALLVWAAHIHDALSTPKPELVNTNGLFFKWTGSKMQDPKANPDKSL